MPAPRREADQRPVFSQESLTQQENAEDHRRGFTVPSGRRRFIQGLAIAGTSLSFLGATTTATAVTPSELTVTDYTEYSVSLSWEPAENEVDRYNVYVDPGEKMHPWQENSSYLWIHTDETAIEVNGLNNGTAYEFFVTAEIDGEESEPTGRVEQETGGQSPAYKGPPRSPANGNPIYGEWTHSLIGAGGKTTGIATTPANHNVVYLRTDVSGTYRSDDKGEYWYMIRRGYAARGFSVDPRDEDTVILAEHDGLYYTDAVGANYEDEDLTPEDVWDHVLEAPFPDPNGTFREIGNVIARHPDDPDTLVAAAEGNDAVYRSTNGGEAWDVVAEPPESIHPTDVRYSPGGTLYLCSKDDDGHNEVLLRSDDDGDSWTAMTEAPPTEVAFDPKTDAIYGLFGDDQNELSLRRSIDGGENWESFADGLAIDGQLSSIAVNDHDDHIYVIMGTEPDEGAIEAGEGFVFRLPAGGETWERHSPVGRDDIDESHWWDDIGGSYENWDGTAELAFDQQDPQQWYLAGTYAVYTSPNEGKRWRYASRGIEEMVGMDVIADPDPDSDLIHAGIADAEYFQLRDHGEVMNFRRQPDIHNTARIEVSPENPDRVYASSANYVFHPELGRFCISEDRGDSWTTIDAREAGLPYLSLDDPGAEWYELAYGPDANQANPVTPFIAGIAADPTDADHVAIAIGGTYGLYDDHWWGGFPDEILAEHGAGEAVGVWRSTDGGQHFEAVPGDLQGNMWELFWIQGNHLAMSGDGSMVIAPMIEGPVQYWDLAEEDWFSADLGASGNAWDVAADPNTDGRFMVPLIDQDGGVYETTDGGESWTQLISDHANGVAYHPENPNWMAITRPDAPTLYSTDSGETWNELDLGMSGGGNHLTFSGNRLIIGAGGSSYFVTELDGDPSDVPEDPSDDDISTIDDADPTDDDAAGDDDSIPGFGAIGTVAALGGLGYVLSEWFGRDTASEQDI